MSSVIVLKSLASSPPSEIVRLERGSLTVGREPENGLVIDSTSVSRRHGAFLAGGSQWFYRDLNSTNGSWVNGVKVRGGVTRLLRSGDTVLISDFAVQTELLTDASSPSVLVFVGDSFHGEFPLGVGEQFQVGGDEADLFIDGEARDSLQCVIQNSPQGPEVVIARAQNPILVNGMAARGTMSLADRDDVSIGLCRIVISIPAQAEVDEGAAQGILDEVAPVPPAQTEVGHHLQLDNFEDDWESEVSRRRSLSGRKFIFGAEEEFDPTGTMSMREDEFRSKAGLSGMGMSQRLSSINQEGEGEAKTGTSDTTYALLGILLLALIAGVVLWVVRYM